jgi:chromate transporter
MPVLLLTLGTLHQTGLIGPMPTRFPAAAIPPREVPSLTALFMAFVSIGLLSFGGGLTAWVRREVVQRRGWLDDQQFLSGYALSQLVPGATNVNLAVFIGTQMRGTLGALACFTGLTALPLLIILVLGSIYFGMRGMPGGTSLSIALSGMGAVAIGLNLGTGIRLARRGIRHVIPALIMIAVAVSIGVLGFPLLRVLAVMIPVSLVAAVLTRPRGADNRVRNELR